MATRSSRSSALARYQQRQAEEGGAYVLTETSATQLIVEDGAVVGVRSGDKGRGKDGEPLGNFEPGTDIKARVTVLAEGCWGHLTGAAIKEFGLGDGPRAPGVGARGQGGLEGPEAARSGDPHVRPVAAEGLAQVRAARRHVDVPDEGREDRRRPGLDRVRRRPQLRATRRPRPTTCCSSSRPHPLVKECSTAASGSPGARRRCPAAATGRCRSSRCQARCSSATPAGWSTPAALKGVHHCIKSGMLAAEAIYAILKNGESLESYEQAVDESSIGKELYQVRNTRQPFQKGFLRRQPARGPGDHVEGQGPARPPGVAPRRRASRCSSATRRRATRSPTASTPSTSSRRSTSR